MASHTSHLLTVLSAALVLTSCAASRYVCPGVGMVPDTDIALIDPIAQISYVDAGGVENVSDQLSRTCVGILSDAVVRSEMYSGVVIPLDGGPFSDTCIEEIMELRERPFSKRTVLAIPPGLDRLLEIQGTRYGMVVYATGFDRDPKGYMREVLRDTFISVFSAVLTMGSVVTYGSSSRYRLSTWVAVLDSQEDRVVYMDCIDKEASPVMEQHVRKQVRKLGRHLKK